MRKTIPIAALLAAALPFVASAADSTGTVTLNSNQYLNLETGAVGSSGDFQFTSTGITFQGTASGYNLGGGGATTYGFLTESTISASSVLFAKTIPAASLIQNVILLAKTTAGHYSKMLVTAVSGSSITMQYTTYGATGGTGGGGGGGGTGGPSITAVQNNYSYIQPGFPNYGISPGTLFIIKGSGLAAPNSPAVLQDSSKGLPTLLNGAQVTVTINGNTYKPAFYYALDTQLALVMPNGVPTGTATIGVTYNGATSNAYTVNIVPAAPGLDAFYGTGAGLGVATNPVSGALYSYTNSVKPGDTIVLWGTGFGGITADSDTTYGTPHSVPTLPTIYFGSVGVTPAYAGGSGFPGLNQINVVVPQNAPTGCNVSLIAVTNNVPSNTLSLPITAGGGVCSDSAFGISGTQLQTLSNATTVRTGFVGIFRQLPVSSSSDVALASFQKTTGTSYNSSNSGMSSIGSCVVSQTVGTSTGVGSTTGLLAGTITLTGPSGSTTLASNPFISGYYTSILNTGFVPTSGGTFTFNATAGSDVGSFSAVLNMPAALTWTNQSASATVARGSGQPINWTGGTAGTYVMITGSSSATVNGQAITGSYTCTAPVSAGTFTVPAPVLLSLPAGTGTTGLFNYANYSTFTASGIDFGFVYGGVQQSQNTTFN